MSASANASGQTGNETKQPAQDAREVVAKHLEASEAYLLWACAASTLKRVLDDRGFGDRAQALARSALALRALLAPPPGDAVARVVEAAEKCHAMVYAYFDGDDPTTAGQLMEAADSMCDRLTAYRASLDALGAGRGSAAKALDTAGRIVREAEEERDRAIAERDEARNERDAAFARRDEAAASLSRSNGLLRIEEDRAVNAEKQRDALKIECDRADEARSIAEARIEEWKRQTVYGNGYREGLNERDVTAQSEIAALRKERDALKADLDTLRASNALVRATLGATDEQSLNDAAQHAVAEVERLKAEVERLNAAGREAVVHMRKAIAQGAGCPVPWWLTEVWDALMPWWGAKEAAKPESSGAKAAPPSPAPLDPRAVAIAHMAATLAAADLLVDADSDQPTPWIADESCVGDKREAAIQWYARAATDLLRAAEAEVRKGVGK